jgi:SAM-dependent methyltransferase
MSRVRNTPPSPPTSNSRSTDSDEGALPEADTATGHDPTLRWVLSDHMDLGETPEPVEQPPVSQPKFIVSESAPASLVIPKGAKTPPPFNYALVERTDSRPSAVAPATPPVLRVPAERTPPPVRRPTPVFGVAPVPVAPMVHTPPPEPEIIIAPTAERPIPQVSPPSVTPEVYLGATPSDFFSSAPTPPPTPSQDETPVTSSPEEVPVPSSADSAELPEDAVEILAAPIEEVSAPQTAPVVAPAQPLPEDVTIPTTPAELSESQPLDAREVEPEAVIMMADSAEHVLETPPERPVSTTPPPVPPSRVLAEATAPAARTQDRTSAKSTLSTSGAPANQRTTNDPSVTAQAVPAAPAQVLAATLFEEYQTPSSPADSLPEALARRSLQKRSKPWYEEVFDDDYLRTVPFMTPEQTAREASFIRESLGINGGAEVLDVACGYGRHAIELAQQGCKMTGLDLSLPLLIKAADQAQKRGLTVNFVHADMREMTFSAQFDAAYCMLSSFGYFDEETNLRVASAVCRAIKPGARFLLEIINRDYIVGDLPSRVWWEGDGCVILEEVDFNYHTSRVLIRRSVVFGNGRQTEQELSMRAYSLHEVGRLLRQAGLRVLDVSGSLATKSRFFGAASKSIIALCERPAT